ncbi:MAG: hypothetical protein V1662_01135 [Candidatus Omnitrophota bacterium]
MATLKKVYRQTLCRWSWALYRRRKTAGAKIEDFIKDDLKLHIGCGDKKLNGYLNIDIVPTEGADIVIDAARDLYRIPSDIAVEIRLESVFEHFYRCQQKKIPAHFYRILKRSGQLIIKWLPDFDLIAAAYLNKSKGDFDKEFDLYNVYRLTHGEPAPENSPQQMHKDIFTKQSITNLLQESGFRIERITNERYGNGAHQETLAVNINVIGVKP